MSSEMVQLHRTSSGHEKKPGGIQNDLNVVDSSQEVQDSFFGPPACSLIRCRICEARQIAPFILPILHFADMKNMEIV